MHPYLRFELLLRRAGGTGAARSGSPIPGPLIRRVLGKALIDRFCPFGRPLCETRRVEGERPAAPRELCHLAEVCPYGVLFAASLTGRPPYALYVPASGEADGAAARLEVTLFGPAWPLYAWVLGCLQEAVRRGLGKERAAWAIEEVRRVRPAGPAERLAEGDLAALPATLRPDLLRLALEPGLAVQEVAVDLLSPARLLRDGRLLAGPEPAPFALLVARILDRFASLYGQSASEILRPDVRSVVEAEAADVPLLADESRWIEVRDYSARSGAELLLGGKVGRVLYGREAGRFLPILLAGEILHLGKNAASGCGRIRVSLLSAGGAEVRAGSQAARANLGEGRKPGEVGAPAGEGRNR